MDTPPHVLIVEDEPELATLYAAWLEDECTVETALDGNEALEAIDETVDVVLLDRRMPGLSGDEILDIIRSEDLDCRVAIVSAVTPDFDVIKMGFDDYLTKPVDRQEVIDTIEQMRRRSSYDKTVQQYYQMVATETALQESKSETELSEHEEYSELRTQREALESEVSAVLEEFSQDDFEAAFREF